MDTIALTQLQKPIESIVQIPGSKSVTNRALIMGALTKNPVIIHNPLWSEDTEAMVEGLNTLGIKTIHCKDSIHVIGNIYDVKDNEFEINTNHSGTTIRFITALCSLVSGKKRIFGSSSLIKRPIGDLVDALCILGADIQYEDIDGYPPILINSKSLKKGSIDMKADVSSQYVSALLMIGPAIGGLELRLSTEQISRSYIDLTIDMMKAWGINVKNDEYHSYNIYPNQEYSLEEYMVEGDYSAGCYFAAFAALAHSKITLKNLKQNTQQGDKAFFDMLRSMGNEVSYFPNEVIITGHGVRPIEVDMELCPDQAQTLAVLAAFAPGKTVLTGVRSLRVKETERVKALQSELLKMNIQTESPDEDTLIIHGGNPKPATIDTFNDHRMAMSFAVAGAKLTGMKINNPEVVKKTFPEFWNNLPDIGIAVSHVS